MWANLKDGRLEDKKHNYQVVFIFLYCNKNITQSLFDSLWIFFLYWASSASYFILEIIIKKKKQQKHFMSILAFPLHFILTQHLKCVSSFLDF